MPRKTFKPQQNVEMLGYVNEEEFLNLEQIERLAVILGYDPSVVSGPIEDAMKDIWLFRYTKDRANPGEQHVALFEAAKLVSALVRALGGIDPGARRRLLHRYGWQASDQFRRDCAALERLEQNLKLAERDCKPKRGQPEKLDERVEAEKIISACELITNAPYDNSPNSRSRSFVITTLQFLGHAQATADGAVREALKRSVRRAKEMRSKVGY